MADGISYTYQPPMENSPGLVGCVVRSSDHAFVPCDLENRDYQEFLTWIAEGNTAPTGWTGPTAQSG